ncbi:hypothetical protein [Methylobacterium sp. J-077]|uniref:hypothetical protein n=1 Tax=Methylobacterium sp. J-077 TaxID=2836656 RepID=UPI001FB8B03F|nr:hypothetical protein [Methylobacterium sp. J-077]MCJ2125059.1 hypothetical protein [Methylobacterium sp. J-077]
MRWRDVLASLGGAVAWPATACSQAPGRRRLGVLLVYGESHQDVPIFVGTLRNSLQKSG